MALSAETISQLEECLNRISSEIVLAQPGADESMIPIYSLLSDIGDIGVEIEAIADAVGYAKEALDRLLDSAQPFDAATLEYLNGFAKWGSTALQAINAGNKPEPWQAYTPSAQAAPPPEEQQAPEEPAAPAPQAAAAEPPPELQAKADVPITLNLDEDRELLEEFQTEAQEHLEAIETSILMLESDPQHADSLAAAFRAYHTIKGVAGFLHLTPVQLLAHEVESLMDLARNHKIVIDSGMATLILESRDAIQKMIDQISAALDQGQMPSEAIPVSALIVRTQQEMARGLAIASGEIPAETPAAPAPKAEAEEQPAEETPPTPEPEAAEGEKGFFEKSTFFDNPTGTPPAPERMEAPVMEAAPPAAAPEAKRQQQSNAASNGDDRATIRVNTLKLDNLMDMVGELVIVQSQLEESARCHALENSPLQQNLSQLHRITKELQHTSMSLRMVPIKPTFQKTSRIVRDVAKQLGKKVNLTLSGEDTELDRTVVEQISDPLVHMIRNAIDHGVESPEKRAAAGKSETGEVKLSAYHMGSSIVIELSDDGAGINAQKVLEKARSQGLLRPDENPTDEEAYQYIFHPGFSTAEKLSDVSGRGVGMDVVKKNIEKLRGAVEVDSVLGNGSVFKIKLPLTMAIIDGMVVRVGDDKFILPTTSVKVTLKATKEQLSTIQGRAEILDLRGRTVPITRLHNKFNILNAVEKIEDGILVIVENFGKPYALLVDEMVSKQEVVIKSLGNMMQQLPGVAGGAILGDGTIAIILDPASIFNA